MSINIALLLAAISAVESSDNDLAVGKRGEVSRYQMLPAVWHGSAKYILTMEEQGQWQNPVIAYQVAERHLRFIRGELPTKLRDDPGAIILSWKKGATGAKRLSYNTHLAHPKTQDYCERVWNTYQDKLKRSQ